MVEYIRSDLEAILFHIKIAEANAAGQPLYAPDPDGAGPLTGGLIPTYNLSWGLRRVDGSYNNLLPGREYWGASDQPFDAHVTPTYRTVMVDPDGPGPSGPVPMSYQPTTVDPDGPGRARPGDVLDPALRTISNLIVDQTLSNPAAIMESLRRDGIEGDHLAIAAEVKAAYVPLKPLFKAVDVAADSYAEAKAANAVNPTPENATAEAAALLALQTAEANLATARADDPDGPGGTPSFDALLAGYGIELSGSNVVLPAIATDEGLSAPFNSWFTLFGQFFDHGLDLVNKGGSGTVFIPLQTDDPLYVPGSTTNFMVLTRATTAPGEDGVFGTADDIRPLNTTTAFVDQNQTYTSHPSHQVFLREYELINGRPEATGHLIEGANGGMANWGELKQYTREHLGFQLLDTDVGMVPLLRTDPYGNFIPGANGFPQMIVGIGADGIPNTADDVVVEGDPSANGGLGVSLAPAIRTTAAFLADIAHNAVPKGLADGDITIGLGNGDGTQTDGTYDNELLDRHFIAGDGRVNENIGLTAVHHIFHAEHNRMVEHTKSVVLADAADMLAKGATEAEAVAFLNEWLTVDVTTVPASSTGLTWDGERLFQAAKFGTEMQYQHLVFEEFARKVQPSINVFIVPDGYDADINPSIMAEFAHVVYRFGHSMLTETVDRFDAGFASDHMSLIEAFLNPVAFDANGTQLDGIGAGDIVRGMTRQVGNQIDEFVTTALRDNLLGLPLDLATINLARGRDTGAPSLNAARREFYDVTEGNPALKPYASWTDFASHLKNEASIINFIAAYGTHSLITGQTTVEGKRDAALTIITGQSVGGFEVPEDAEDFLNAMGSWAPDGTGPNDDTLGGLENVDLWIGGLAEATMPFGGMLGSTFNFVFEVQMESLQNGDRFYYLQRNTGQHLFEQLEANSLASLIMRHTDATHLPADVFSTPALILEVDPSRQFNDLDGDGDLEGGDPLGASILSPLVVRNNPATAGPDSNYLRYAGADHVVLGGTNGANILIAGIGDDTLYGDGGNDILEGGFGNDNLLGGDGDDIMTDTGGDDVFKGGKGNDAMAGGAGIDLFLAGDGNDFVVMGNDDGAETFAGLGNDFVLSSPTSEPVFGNEGDDWIENGGNVGLFGDNNDDGFARDGIRGNDVLVGVGGMFDEYIAEGGDDIMVGSLGSAKHAGMSGFDWVTYKNLTNGVIASLSDGFIFDEAPVDPADIAAQAFESVEGLSGTRFDDRLSGTDFTADARDDHAFLGSALDAQGIALIDGLQDLLGAGVTSYTAGDILLGGDGNDQFFGGGGDDYIDGDKWLNVRISIRANRDGSGPEIGSADSMTQLAARIFSGEINPGQLVIVREIKSDETNVTGDLMNIDTAIFSGTLADYVIEGRTVDASGLQLTKARDVNGDGMISVSDSRTTDGTDLLKNIEELRFADQTLVIGGPNYERPPVIDLHAFDIVTTNTADYADNFNVQSFTNSTGTTPWTTSWVETNDGANTIGGGQIQTNQGGTGAMRFIVGDGASISRAVSLVAGTNTTLSYTYSYSGLDTGDQLLVEFASDGVNFVTIQTIAGAVATNANLGPTVASFAVNGTANSVLRFTTSTLTDIESIRIDDVSINSGTSVQVPVVDGTGFTTTFTEDEAPVRIALNSAITDPDSSAMVSAQIRLTNAQALDALSIAGALPAGITSSFGPPVAGEITLFLSGLASRAAYQTAIEAVRFANTSLNPSVAPRNIEVTVTDPDGRQSVAAIATVNVVTVNDAPVTVADAVVTNDSSGNIVIPEWVLLGNDSDPEGAALDITAVSAAVGVNGLSLATNPGSVTLFDDGTSGGSFIYTASDGNAVPGIANGAVTLTNTGYASVADNFNGLNNTTPSAANNSTGTVSWTGSSWVETNDDANIRAGQVQIDAGAAPGTNDLRFGVGDGASITRTVNLAGVTSATLSLAFDKNGIDVGESVQVQFAADGVNFVTLNTITNTNGTANNGNAAGTLNLALTGALGANSAIRFVGSGINTAGEDIRIDNVAVSYVLANAAIVAGAGNQILVGNDAGSQLTGGAGNDTVLANGGDDTINWSVGHGRDFIDGGSNGTVGDRFIVNGDATVETFLVYARAEAISAGVSVQNAATEIVVTRNGVVIAELDNVEEITINTGAGADTVQAIGNFNPTALFFNTITVNGGAGARDIVDSSQLTSAHKLVLAGAPAATTGSAGRGFADNGTVMRRNLLDQDEQAPIGMLVWSKHGGMASAMLHNPIHGRILAPVERMPDLGDPLKIEDSAAHFIAADYLII